ncbi:MAG: 3-oxoacyl-[acyl-carrier-protein] reductase [Lachnospiraceae bacterium]|nr:3-oxoacyl-[acyl-carrier-protein] reductase [Lachnospiraceae bacterium]
MLTGKIALVTGASRGIGAAAAKKLAENGAFVYVNYNGSQARADEVVAAIKEAGGDAESVKCDVADFNACKEMIDKIIADKGRLDILVNNAGITRDDLLMKMSEEAFDAVISTNLKGCFNTIRHSSRYFLKQRSGKIINMSSVSGVAGNAGQANYSSAKAGVIGLTKSVAKELGSRGINCNAIAPGFIETEMTEAMTDKAKEATIAMIPFGRTGKTEDIAKAVLFLASDMSDYITGQILNVDGGMCI